MLRSVILFLAIFAVAVSATNVKKCKKGPLPISTIIEGCETLPCDVIKGTTAIMNAQFVGTHDNIRSMTTKVRATVLGLTVPYALPDDVADVCANLLDGATCPIDEGEDAIYSFKFPIDNSYPEISVKVEVSLVDDDTNEPVACFVADIKVKKGSSL
ncbi:NPC intracellular cholesterol transporter 2-like [Episyrphus balteatus]|uniref:NPC intracellular cholesterol transporter 2-like n=1 Tax=Episyrphus balteatus TaxID=286459 RepID=UPI00248601F1|nr:NPC intracellular cholesterol transporter 2-like [Episyrphus balteatus]